MNTKINGPQEQIHQRFKYFGAKHLEYRQKCIGLLPQIFKERIHERKGFDSVFEYAAKMAGLSREQVSRALNVHAGFSDLPVLRTLFETGEVSINKLARVASIATKENENDLANQVKILSKNALETLVKDIRRSEEMEQGNICQKSSQKPILDPNNVPGHNSSKGREFASPSKIIALKLTTKNLEKLMELQGKGIDINEIIETALFNRDAGIEEEKRKVAEVAGQAHSRYIPAAIRKIINAEQGDRCAMPGCSKKAEVIHHDLPFAMTKIHNPNHLKKLCRAHHEIAHGINLKIYEIKKTAMNSG